MLFECGVVPIKNRELPLFSLLSEPWPCMTSCSPSTRPRRCKSTQNPPLLEWPYIHTKAMYSVHTIFPCTPSLLHQTPSSWCGLMRQQASLDLLSHSHLHLLNHGSDASLDLVCLQYLLHRPVVTLSMSGCQNGIRSIRSRMLADVVWETAPHVTSPQCVHIGGTLARDGEGDQTLNRLLSALSLLLATPFDQNCLFDTDQHRQFRSHPRTVI